MEWYCAKNEEKFSKKMCFWNCSDVLRSGRFLDKLLATKYFLNEKKIFFVKIKIKKLMHIFNSLACVFGAFFLFSKLI